MDDVWKPHATVAAVIERDGRFLMVEEIAGGKQVYNQPAGHLEPGESLVDAVIRETLEETAAVFKPSCITGIYRWQMDDESEKSFLRFTFTGECTHIHTGQPLDDGIIQAVWMTRDELAAQPEKLRSPMVLNCIDDYLDGKQYPLELLTDVE